MTFPWWEKNLYSFLLSISSLSLFVCGVCRSTVQNVLYLWEIIRQDGWVSWSQNLFLISSPLAQIVTYLMALSFIRSEQEVQCNVWEEWNKVASEKKELHSGKLNWVRAPVSHKVYDVVLNLLINSLGSLHHTAPMHRLQRKAFTFTCFILSSSYVCNWW